MSETVLVVDDEDGVRKTFVEWLAGLPNVRVLAAADAEAALMMANEQPIDLAILDWNLGSGMDGLRLLEDLAVFLPDIVAILVTGYANQATPLEALRLGVRDYFDKNQNLTREVFLNAVRVQLEKIIPAKRQRLLNHRLHEFRTTLEKVLPLVQSSATLNDPVPLPTAIQSVFRFLMRTTGAKAGALVVRHVVADTDSTVAYQHDGLRLPTVAVPYRSSLAATVLGMNQPSVLLDMSADALGGVQLQPFEQNRMAILLAPLSVAPGVQAVLELFDAPTFNNDHKQLVSSTTDIAAELLRHSLAQRQSNDLLYAAVESALQASHEVSETLTGTNSTEPPATNVMEQLRQTLEKNPNAVAEAGTSLRLMEAVRELGLRYGESAVEHCVTLVESVHQLLDTSAGLISKS